MDYGISGRTTLVTGASQGIGRAIALTLAREGARLAVCARGEEALGDLVERVRLEGGEATPFRADVGSAEGVASLLERVRSSLGDPEILVVNAGGPPKGPAAELPDRAWLEGYELTLMSAVRLARGCVGAMRARGWGRIVNVTSLSVREPIAKLTLSNAFRAGVTGFAKTLATEVAGDGVTVNAVAPGYTATERLSEVFESEEALAAFVRSIPAGRLARPEEIALAVAFLVSEGAGYVTGQTLLVDGGVVGSSM